MNQNFKKICILLCVIISMLVITDVIAQTREKGTELIIPQKGSAPEAGELVELNFQNIEVRTLLDVISQFTRKSFLFHERDLKNRRITLISPKKYSIEEAYDIFEKILVVNDLRLIQEANNIIRVVNVNDAKKALISNTESKDSADFGSNIIVTRVILVENTNINTVFKAINPFLSKSGTIIRFDPTNSFIIKDTLENTKRIAELVKVFDTKTDYQVKKYPLKYIPVNQLKVVLQKVINKNTTTSREQFFSYNKEKNEIIAVARANEIKILEDLIKKLDVSVADLEIAGFKIQFIAIQYLKVNDVINFLQKVFKTAAPKKGGTITIEGSIIIPIEDTNSFIAYGPDKTIEKLVRYVKKIDQATENIVLEVIPILHSDANTVSKLVNQVFQSRVAAASPLKLKTFVESGTNSLILLGTAKTIEKIRNFVLQFDKPRTVTDSQGFKFYFYPVKHARATNIAAILSNISSNITKQAVSSIAEAKTEQLIKTKKNKKAVATPIKTTNKEAGKENQLSIVADDETNSLIIYANQAQYNIIINAIKDLDIVRPQVFVEALIVEVSLNKTLDLGLNYSRSGIVGSENKPTGVFNFTTPGNSGARPLPSTIGGVQTGTAEAGAGGIAGLGTGAIAGVFGDVFSYGGADYVGYSSFIRALATDTEVNILSNPKIITLNNKKAVINVGENRPILTSTSISSNGTVTPNYDYKDIGVKIEILPHINSGDYITLEISQENTSVAGTNNDDDTLPTTLKRALTTEVIVKSGETLALGGLVNDEKQTIERKVPCLGDIPFLGYLFKTKTSSSRKVNLVIFITPTIVRTAEDQANINKKAIEQINTPLKDLRKNIKVDIDNILKDE